MRLEVMMGCKRSICVTVNRHWLTALSNDEWQVDSRIEIGKYSDHLSVIVFGGYSYAGAKIDNRKQDVRSSSGRLVEQKCF